MDATAFTSALAAVFVVGLLGGVHCIGMCGGIVALLSSGGPVKEGATANPDAAPGVRVNLDAIGTRRVPPWRIQLAFNAGRIAMYGVAGAIAGAAGSLALFFDGALPVQLAMYVFANLMLAGLGLYLLGITRYIGAFERAGALLWRRIQPVMRHVMPTSTVPRALGLGALWGWMPCGLVYSILATALLTGSALQGAVLMLAFGLGTLPNLLFAGALMRWLAARQAGPWVRKLAGATVLALGVAGMAHAGVAGQHAVAALLCFTPG